MDVRAFDHVVFNVQNIELSAAWYARVLGMRRQNATAADGSTRSSMVFGRNEINLRPVSATQEAWFTARVPSAGSADLCFLTDAPPDSALDHLRALGIAVEQGPVEKSGATGPIRSVYVRDPDGSLIEIASYP